jgi:hypothetical protein
MVYHYISDLLAAIKADLDLKIFRMGQPGIPQERISNLLCLPQKTISDHLAKIEIFQNPLNSDLKQGFTVSQVAEKHGWPDSLVWALKLKGNNDIARCRELQWGTRTWYNFQDNRRFM